MRPLSPPPLVLDRWLRVVQIRQGLRLGYAPTSGRQDRKGPTTRWPYLVAGPTHCIVLQRAKPRSRLFENRVRCKGKFLIHPIDAEIECKATFLPGSRSACCHDCTERTWGNRGPVAEDHPRSTESLFLCWQKPHP